MISEQNIVNTNSNFPHVCLVFRRPTPLFFSIEKIFGQLASQFEKQVKLQQVYAPDYSSSVLNIVKNIRALRRQKADVYHITGDIHYGVLAFPANKTILTIHDCVFLYNYKGLKKKVINWLFLKWPSRHCRYITTISEKSKAEIIQHTGCDPNKIIVIPNPVPGAIFFEPKIFNEQSPVLLFIGSTPNKNLPRVLEALRGISCRLRLIGSILQPMRQKLEEYAINYSAASGLTEDQLAREYAAADIVLFPSLYEGFGLPVLEGQQAGRAVVTSNLSPMKEVAGDGACLVDPYNVDAIREGVTKVIRNKEYRESIIQKGFKNVATYSASSTAGRYLEVYKNMTG